VTIPFLWLMVLDLYEKVKRQVNKILHGFLRIGRVATYGGPSIKTTATQ
jgi:hypothetical protein